MSIINPIFEQTLYYFIVMLLSVFILALVQKGFFFKFMKVRVSFGKYILVKIRSVNRDYYSIGSIDEGFLVFKSTGGTKRLSIPNNSVFYRSLGIAWVDIDEQKNAIACPDYTVISGFDPVKFEELYKRCLYKPGIKDNTTKIIIGGLFIILFAVIIVAFMVYRQNYQFTNVVAQLNSVKGVIAGGNV